MQVSNKNSWYAHMLKTFDALGIEDPDLAHPQAQALASGIDQNLETTAPFWELGSSLNKNQLIEFEEFLDKG